jgi:hypothetical protein
VGGGEREAEAERQVARHPDVPERVGTVGGDAQLDQRVGHAGDRERQRRTGRERRTDRCGAEHHDAAVVRADPELVLRAQHPRRRDAADLAGPDREAPGQHRADSREQHESPRVWDVRSAAHHLHRPLAVVDLDHLQPVGRRVRHAPQHLRHDHGLEPLAHALDPLHLEPEAGQRARDLSRVERRRCAVGSAEQRSQPRQGDQHGNCSKNRTSPSNISRRSWIW